MSRKSIFFRPGGEGEVQCTLCPRECLLTENKTGVCGVRKNIDEELVDLAWGVVIAMHVDPIEKKPLFHFLPGTQTFSVAAPGCNLKCVFCQNAEISQVREGRIRGKNMTPGRLVDSAKRFGTTSISYTYTEPTAYFEFALDSARLAWRSGLKNIFVTNGYINPGPLDEVLPYLHAANVDLKFFSEDSYKNYTGGSLAPVKTTIETLRRAGKWVEVTTLVIPGLNDSPGELADIAGFIAEVDADIPWHISRFYPHYRMTDREVTPPDAIAGAREIGKQAGLRFVYSGNLPGDKGENTYCPACGSILLSRVGFTVSGKALAEGKCPACSEKIAGIWS